MVAVQVQPCTSLSFSRIFARNALYFQSSLWTMADWRILVADMIATESSDCPGCDRNNPNFFDVDSCEVCKKSITQPRKHKDRTLDFFPLSKIKKIYPPSGAHRCRETAAIFLWHAMCRLRNYALCYRSTTRRRCLLMAASHDSPFSSKRCRKYSNWCGIGRTINIRATLNETIGMISTCFFGACTMGFFLSHLSFRSVPHENKTVSVERHTELARILAVSGITRECLDSIFFEDVILPDTGKNEYMYRHLIKFLSG